MWMCEPTCWMVLLREEAIAREYVLQPEEEEKELNWKRWKKGKEEK